MSASRNTDDQLARSDSIGHRTSLLRRLAPPGLIVVVGLLLYLPGIRWGLPATVSWSQDTIAGVRTLGAVQTWPGEWKGRYPPLQYLLLAAAYKPVLQYWEGTGARSVDPATGRATFQPPHAPKIATLILIARGISVIMAIAAGLGLWAAGRILTGDALAAILAAIAMMIGAAYVYFAHLGNVDIPSMCWFTWSVYFFARLLKSRRLGDAVLLGLFGSLAISTKDALAGVYPGMAMVLLVAETKARMGDQKLVPALLRSVLQIKWLVGLLAFALPYLSLYGVLWDPESYLARMRYWLDPPAGTLHASQQRFSNQLELLWGTVRHAAGAVGWPLLAAMAASVWYTLRRHCGLALIVLTPAFTYYLMVIAPINFVYSRFLFAPLAFLCILVGLAGARLLRCERVAKELRLGVPAGVLLLSLGYTVALDAEMIYDSRYQAERWMLDNAEPTAGVGSFSKAQYMPRFHELGYGTYSVEMARESFTVSQPEYLVLTSYNYEDFNDAQEECLGELLRGRLGYTPVATFRGRFLAGESSWLSIAGWGAPTPGKISPTITILQRNRSLNKRL